MVLGDRRKWLELFILLFIVPCLFSGWLPPVYMCTSVTLLSRFFVIERKLSFFVFLFAGFKSREKNIVACVLRDLRVVLFCF